MHLPDACTLQIWLPLPIIQQFIALAFCYSRQPPPLNQ